MADIQSTIIQSLAKVIDSSQSGYGPNGLGAKTQAQTTAHAVVLTVVNVRDSQIILQDQASGKRIAVDKQALQGLAASNLSKGDNLTLLNSNEDVAMFSVEKSRIQSKQVANSLGSQYRAPLAQILAVQWPDINASSLRRIPPNVLNQIVLDADTPNTQQLTKTLIDIANKSNQPLVNIKLEAKIKQIVGNVVQLSVLTQGQNKGPLNLEIPLTPELNTKLAVGKNIALEFDANNMQNLVKKIRLTGNQSVSSQALATINKALVSNSEHTKQFLAQVLFSTKNTKAAELVFVPSRDNLQQLSPSIKNALLADTSPAALKDARLIAAPINTGNANTKIEISLVAKPSILNIDAKQLAQASRKVELVALVDIAQNKAPTTTTSQVDLSQSAKSQQNIDIANKVDKSGVESTVSIKQDVLRSKLIETLSQLSAKVDSSKIATDLKSNIGNVSNEAKINSANISPDAKVSEVISQLKASISDEINQTLPKSESISKVLPALVTQLVGMQSSAGTELKNIIANVLKQIESTQVIGDLSVDGDDGSDDQQINAARIKEVFTQAALPNITAQNLLAQAIQPIGANQSQGNLVNGLITMLQASLQARLVAQQPNLLASIAQLTANFAQTGSGKGLKPNPTASKALQDLNKLDPRGSLIGELTKVLSNHSLHKLSAAESNLQGQDSFFYALPNMFSPLHKDIEILIKREHHTSQEESKKETQQHWQLSMKLDIGDSGEVLAKVKLFQDQVDLNLYASNQKLKEKILDYLPYLNRRLVALGLQVKPKCFLGKIPTQLYKTDYQVVQTYV